MSGEQGCSAQGPSQTSHDRPEASRTVRPAHHLRHVADQSRLQQDLERLAVRMVLVAHLRHHASALLLRHEHLALLVGMCERLLDVDVLAEAHRVETHDRVRVVGRTHRHRVEILVVLEHLAPVHVRGNAGVALRRARKPRRVDVAERRHGGARLAQFATRHAADAARADNGKAQLLARQILSEQRPRGDEEGPGSRADERPSRQISHYLLLPFDTVFHVLPSRAEATIASTNRMPRTPACTSGKSCSSSVGRRRSRRARMVSQKLR